MGRMNAFQSKFGIGKQSSIDTGVSSSSGLCLNSTTNFDTTDLVDIFNDKAIGTASELGELEFKYTHYGSINIPFVVNTEMAYLMFSSLFQYGNVSSGTSHWFFPYSYDSDSMEANNFYSIVKYLEDESKRMIGGVNKTVRLTFDNNNFMSAMTTFHGREVESEYSISDGVFETSNRPLLTWNECNAKIGNGYSDLNDFSFNNIYINIDNGLSARKYNNDKISKFILGDIMANGVLEVPFDNYSSLSVESIINLFENSDPVRIVLTWGENSTKMKIALLAKNITLNSRDDNDEYIRFNFNLVENMSLSEHLGGWSVDDLDNNLIRIDPLGGTLINNLFPGDKFVYRRQIFNIVDVPSYNTVKLESMNGLNENSAGGDYVIIRHPINVNVNLN